MKIYQTLPFIVSLCCTPVAAMADPGPLPWTVVSTTRQPMEPNHGYAAINDELTILTLPSSPQEGDLIGVMGPGKNGFMLAQNAGQSVKNLRRTVGAQWKTRWQDPAFQQDLWSSAASSADGTKLVAVDTLAIGSNTEPFNRSGLIFTSTDGGAHWTARNPAAHWKAVVSSADGNKLVATVEDGPIYTSTDGGVNWTQRNVPSRKWSGLASSADGEKVIATVADGPIFLSSDSGVTWKDCGFEKKWASVALSADGSKLVGVVAGGPLYFSTVGCNSLISWANAESLNYRSVALSGDGKRLVAVVSDGSIYTSTNDGATMTNRTGKADRWLTVAISADGNTLVAGGWSIMSISKDGGETWTESGLTESLNSVALSADGNRLVATQPTGSVLTSEGLLMATGATTVGTGGFVRGLPGTSVELRYQGNNQFIIEDNIGSLYAY